VIVAITGLSVVLVFKAATFALSGLVILLGVLARPATAGTDSSRSLLGSATLAAPYAAQISHGPAVAGVLMAAGAAGIVIGLWLLPMLIPDQRTGHVVAPVDHLLRTARAVRRRAGGGGRESAARGLRNLPLRARSQHRSPRPTAMQFSDTGR
jgi:hypothetical protein